MWLSLAQRFVRIDSFCKCCFTSFFIRSSEIVHQNERFWQLTIEIRRDKVPHDLLLHHLSWKTRTMKLVSFSSSFFDHNHRWRTNHHRIPSFSFSPWLWSLPFPGESPDGHTCHILSSWCRLPFPFPSLSLCHPRQRHPLSSEWWPKRRSWWVMAWDEKTLLNKFSLGFFQKLW